MVLFGFRLNALITSGLGGGFGDGPGLERERERDRERETETERDRDRERQRQRQTDRRRQRQRQRDALGEEGEGGSSRLLTDLPEQICQADEQVVLPFPSGRRVVVEDLVPELMADVERLQHAVAVARVPEVLQAEVSFPLREVIQHAIQLAGAGAHLAYRGAYCPESQGSGGRSLTGRRGGRVAGWGRPLL